MVSVFVHKGLLLVLFLLLFVYICLIFSPNWVCFNLSYFILILLEMPACILVRRNVNLCRWGRYKGAGGRESSTLDKLSSIKNV